MPKPTGSQASDDAQADVVDVDPGLLLDAEIVPPAFADVPSEGGRQRTAKKAVEILLAADLGYHQPSGEERRALLVAFAMTQRVLYGAAFDAVQMTRPINLTDPHDIVRNMDALTVLEIKSTNRSTVGESLRGYFFALTTAELLVAQSLKGQFKFAFVHTVTRQVTTLTLQELFARARGIYPTWSIRF